jgi:hypothetical protein
LRWYSATQRREGRRYAARAEGRERGLDVLLAICGDGQHIDSLVGVRVRVQAGAELHADRLQVGYELLLLEMGRAVERQVLDHVGQAALVVVLEHGAGLDHEPQLDAVLRLAVALDVIGQAVRQLADLDPGADRHAGVQVDGGAGGQQGCRGRCEHRGAEQGGHPVVLCNRFLVKRNLVNGNGAEMRAMSQDYYSCRYDVKWSQEHDDGLPDGAPAG